MTSGPRGGVLGGVSQLINGTGLVGGFCADAERVSNAHNEDNKTSWRHNFLWFRLYFEEIVAEYIATPCYSPVPVRLMISGLPKALFEMVTVPVRVPVAVG